MKKPYCAQCHAVATATAPETLVFCGPEHAHEWSALRLDAATPAATFAVLDQVRLYLLSLRSDDGAALELGRLQQLAARVWPELKGNVTAHVTNSDLRPATERVSARRSTGR